VGANHHIYILEILGIHFFDRAADRASFTRLDQTQQPDGRDDVASVQVRVQEQTPSRVRIELTDPTKPERRDPTARKPKTRSYQSCLSPSQK
jgi:hypothetical protein